MTYVDVRNREDDESTKQLFKQTIPLRFDLENKWLKGDQYAHILQNHMTYGKVFGFQHFEKKTHPENIYLSPQNGQVYFVKGNTIGSDFGFPRLGIKKHYKWKKMNFTTDLPKRNPLVSYIVASAVQAEKFFEGSNQKAGPVYRMHAVILKPEAKTFVEETNYILCHIRQVQDVQYFVEGVQQETKMIQHVNPEIPRTLGDMMGGHQDNISFHQAAQQPHPQGTKRTRRQQALVTKDNRAREEVKDMPAARVPQMQRLAQSPAPVVEKSNRRRKQDTQPVAEQQQVPRQQLQFQQLAAEKAASDDNNDLMLYKRRRRAYTEIGDFLQKGQLGDTDGDNEHELMSLQDLPAVRRTLRRKREEKFALKNQQRDNRLSRSNIQQNQFPPLTLSDALASGLGAEGNKLLSGFGSIGMPHRRLSMEEINVNKEKKILVKERLAEWLKNFSKQDLIEQTKEYFEKNPRLKDCVKELLPKQQQQSSGSKNSSGFVDSAGLQSAFAAQMKSSSESPQIRSNRPITNASVIDQHQEFLEKVFMQPSITSQPIPSQNNNMLSLPNRDRNDSFSAFKKYDKQMEKPFVSPRMSFTNSFQRPESHSIHNLPNPNQSLQNNISAANQQQPLLQNQNSIGDVFTNFLAQQLGPLTPQQQQSAPIQQPQQLQQQPQQQTMQPHQPQQQIQQQPQQRNSMKFGDMQAAQRVLNSPNMNFEQANGGSQMKAQMFQDQMANYNINSVNMLEQILGGTNRSKLSFDFNGKNPF